MVWEQLVGWRAAGGEYEEIPLSGGGATTCSLDATALGRQTISYARCLVTYWSSESQVLESEVQRGSSGESRDG